MLILRIFPFFCVLLFSSAAIAGNLSVDWMALKSSWFGGEMYISCLAADFKMEKSISGNYTVLFLDKDGNWSALDTLKVSDEAISFDGLGKMSSGLIQRRFSFWDDMVKYVAQPEFEQGGVKPRLVGAAVANDTFVPLTYFLNFVSGGMRSENRHEFKVIPIVQYNYGGDVRLPEFLVRAGEAVGFNGCLSLDRSRN